MNDLPPAPVLPPPGFTPSDSAGPVASRRADPPDPPATVREAVAVVAAVALFDLLIYRTGGYAAAGLFFAGLIPLFAFGSPFPRANWRGFAAAAALLSLVALRLVWSGYAGAVLAGFAGAAAIGLARAGRPIWVLDLPVFLLQSAPAGPAALVALRSLIARHGDDGAGGSDPSAPGPGDDADRSDALRPLAVLLPAGAGLAFAGLFVLANPDLKEQVGGWLGSLSARFGDAVRWIVPGPWQTALWIIVGGVVLGALRPLVRRSLLDPLAEAERDAAATRAAAGPARSAAYPTVRNTLLVVVVLFAAYLPYEFATLWRRDFPDGFYFAGYAHEGAAWLTVALAAATVLLSAMFRGSVTADPRVSRLRRLAWIWSGLNFLLVAAVCNRLLIYVDFNGLSRMRVVGFLGIAAVAAGFAVVVVKVARDRGFAWLVRRQLRAAGLVAAVGLLAPVDWLAHAYNARRVAAGDPAPLALVGNHPIDLGGLLALEPVLGAENEIAARGVAGRMRRAEQVLNRRPTPGAGPLGRLGEFQLAEVQFRRMLARNAAEIDALLADTTPDRAARRLGRYGMRWW